MAGPPKSGDKKIKGKARQANATAGRRTGRTKAPISPAAKPRMRRPVSDLAKELKELRAQKAATSGVLKAISRSTFDLQTVLETLIKSAVQLCGANRGSIFLREGDVFPLRAASSTTPQFLQFWAANPPKAGCGSATARVIASGKVEVIADVLADPAMEMPAESLKNIRAALGVPMLRENRVEGVMVLTRPEPGPFSQSQIDLVQTFADQAVIAIENTRLFNETKESLERQTATADILRVIAGSPTNLQPVFDAIAERSNRLLGGHATAVYRLTEDTVHLMAFTPVSREADAALKASYPRTLANPHFKAVQNGEIVQIPDVFAKDVLEITKYTARVRGFRSLIFMPLSSDSGPIGAISVTRKEVGAFSEHHVQLLRTFADQAVIAISNVELFKEVQAKTQDLGEALQQQTATADVLKVISRSAFDLQTVFETLVQSAAQLCRADKAAILRLKDNKFHIVATHGFPLQFREFMAANPMDLDRGSVTGRAALERRTVHVPDILADPEFTVIESQKRGGFRTVLGVPLLREGNPIGALFMTRGVVELFTQQQIDLVTTFADQAVIAIENVRLFDEVQARTKELSQSLDELRTAQDRLVQTEKLASLGQLTAGIAHEIKNPLNFINNFSALSTELIDELDQTLTPAPLDNKMRADISELTSMLKSNLEKVVQHGKRADSIVKNMLLHSREGSGEHRSADINALVEESLNLAYHGARAETTGFNITLRRALDPQAGAAELYPQEITRALLNLISNGFYAATTRQSETGDGTFEPTLDATTKNLGNRVEIRIRDNGAGITPEVREKMFNPFFTTKPAGEGTGLGLSMSYDIVVKQHGGTIDVETEPGAFTEFIITLPRNLPNTSGAKI
jgi:GAF domain-containing protein